MIGGERGVDGVKDWAGGLFRDAKGAEEGEEERRDFVRQVPVEVCEVLWRVTLVGSVGLDFGPLPSCLLQVVCFFLCVAVALFLLRLSLFLCVGFEFRFPEQVREASYLLPVHGEFENSNSNRWKEQLIYTNYRSETQKIEK